MKTLVSIAEVTEMAKRSLLKVGIDEHDADCIVEHLLDGELAGHSSHGFYRIPGIVNAAKKAGVVSSITFEKETPCSVLIDGGKRQGLVVAFKGTEIAINKAKASQMAIVGGYGYVGTTGAMGYFTRKIADNGLIGIMFATSAEGVSPWGGTEMILGTNPISISIPSNNEPVVTDLATSKWAYGDLALAMINNQKIPEGVVLDKDGNPSTDPHDADNGSQLPFGEHKGYALGLCFEILAGPLVGAKAGVKAVPGSDGYLIIALNPTLFVSLDQFKSNVSSLITEVKNSKRRPGFDEIFIPGEQSQKRRRKNQGATQIEIMTGVLEKLKVLADSN